MLRSRGFNEPKKVNAHGLSNFKSLERTYGKIQYVTLFRS
jgi:hypothetical protein